MSNPGRDARPRARKTSAAKLRERAQTLAPKALKTLAIIMQDEKSPATIRLAAAREVLDRGHGRPKLGGAADEPEGLTVILKRYSDVTEAEEALGDEGEP